MTRTPTDALRLVPVEPSEAMLEAAFDAFEINHPMQYRTGTEARKAIWSAMLAAAPASPLPGGGLSSDVVRLVIAARRVAYEGAAEDDLRALDIAAEAFASRVPWDDEPDEIPAAPTGDA